jgi:adenylate cyclase
VFTDIVGFTHFTEERGDDVALALLERKEKLVRDALPDCGRVVKELGDGLLLWFDDVCEAFATCVALQVHFEREATDDLPLWVRMGLHWGSPRRRGDDIVGRDVNLAARIVELAGPGEVLCSAVAVEAAGRVSGIEFEELGPVFVRGLDDPVPLMRAVATPG